MDYTSIPIPGGTVYTCKDIENSLTVGQLRDILINLINNKYVDENSYLMIKNGYESFHIKYIFGSTKFSSEDKPDLSQGVCLLFPSKLNTMEKYLDKVKKTEGEK